MRKSKLLIAAFALCMAGFALFYAVPFANGLIRSFSAEGTFTLDNYVTVLRNESFRLALGNTVWFTAACVVLSNLLGFILAYLLGQVKKRSLFFGMLLPLAIPVISTTSFWNYILGFLPYEVGYGSAAPVVILIVFLWKYLGFHIMIYYAAISSVSKRQIEGNRQIKTHERKNLRENSEENRGGDMCQESSFLKI